MNAKHANEKDAFPGKGAFNLAGVSPSAFASLANLTGRNINGMDIGTASENSADIFSRQLPSIPAFNPRLSNPLNSFTSGMPLYMRRDVSSPSDSSNNGVNISV